MHVQGHKLESPLCIGGSSVHSGRGNSARDHDRGAYPVSTLILLWMLILPYCSTAQAEVYVAGQVAATIPEDLSEVQLTATRTGISTGPLMLADSVMYGGKLGYMFERPNWLGLEMEAYTTTPNLKAPTITVPTPLGSLTSQVRGAHVRVTTVAFNVLVQYPAERVRPYAGVGLGVFLAGIPVLDTSVGLNALAGLRVFLTERLALFAEYKYNRASLDIDFKISGVGNVTLKAIYMAHHLGGGISYHFAGP